MTFPMDADDDNGGWADGGGAPPPAPGAAGIAAQQAISMLAQHAAQTQAAHYAQAEANVHHLTMAWHRERARMQIPNPIQPTQAQTIHTIIREYLPAAAAPTNPTGLYRAEQQAAMQAMNVDLNNAEGAARAHARQGGELGSMVQKIARKWTPKR